MMRSMYSGVSGLRVHQTKMDVIGNNIANVNTIGFKSQRVNFNEVFSQTLQSSTGPNDATGRGGRNAMQVGLGVNVSSIDTLMTQGAAQRTDNPFDLMIDGEGFIIVGDDSGKFFTRAGALRQDDDGNLVIPNGMKVMGWTNVTLDKDGKEVISPGEVGPISLGKPENKTAAPETTTKAQISGNLDKKDGVKDGGIPVQIKMYDSLGNLYYTSMNMTFDEATSTWTIAPQLTTIGGDQKMCLTDTNGNEYYVDNVFNGTDGNPTDELQMKFNDKGELIGVGNDPDETKWGKSINLGAINLNSATDKDGNPKTLNATIGDGTSGVNVDVAQITQFASKTTVEPKTIDGKAPGTIMGFDVTGDGKITAYYDNGSTKLLGQICLAQFENPAGLEKVGDNLFKATANSGDFDNIGKAGNFQAGVLEMSNVDLSREFTEMITTQRGFQANSRIISVSDEMLQELVNLKR